MRSVQRPGIRRLCRVSFAENLYEANRPRRLTWDLQRSVLPHAKSQKRAGYRRFLVEQIQSRIALAVNDLNGVSLIGKIYDHVRHSVSDLDKGVNWRLNCPRWYDQSFS